MERHLDPGVFEAVLERLSVAVSIQDASRRVVFQNAAHRKIFGQARDEPCHELLWGRPAPCPHCPLDSGIEKVLQASLPNFGPAEVRSVLLPHGETYVLEMTQRPSATAVVLEALHQAFEMAENAIFVEEMDGTIREVNRAAEQLFGLGRKELVGRSVLEVLPEEAVDQVPYVIRQLEEKGTFQLEAWQRRGDGSKFVADVEGVRFHGPERPLVFVSVRDATAARMGRKVLEERSQEMEAFLHTVAHDLKTPLVGLKGFAALLEKEVHGASDRAREFAARVAEQSERLEALLDDLLEFAQVGQSMETVVAMDAEASAREAWLGLSDRVAEADGVLEIAGPLPRVRMAPVHLNQVFTNLFANALKYRRDDVRPSIRVGAVEPEPEWGVGEGQACLVVEDNGVGVPKEDREVIFNLFRQGTVKRGGTGVGLAIVRRVVQGAGGTVWVESCPGEGSRFYLTLPAAGPAEKP